MMVKQRIAILASGGGSNAEAIMHYFANHATIEVAIVVTNRKNAGVRERAHQFGVPCVYFPKREWTNKELILSVFDQYRIDFIVLAGFLLLIPQYLVERYANRMVNIHPALLPKFGGKGMYGMNVHRAVKAAGETESGITIHLVTEHYDEGEHLFQTSVALAPGDDPEAIAQKVLQLEHQYFAPVIERFILSAAPSPES